MEASKKNTNRKQGERPHKDPWFKNYAEAMPQMAFIANPEGDIIYFNQRWYDYVAGMEGTEGWGWKDKPIHHPDDLQRTIKRWKQSLQTGKIYEIEYRLRRHDGLYFWHLGRAVPVRDNYGKIKFWFGTNTDIHKQKVTEEELLLANEELTRQNEKMEKLRELRENLLHIIAHDLKGPLGNMELIANNFSLYEKEMGKEAVLQYLQEMVSTQKSVIDGISDIIHVQNTSNVKFETINTGVFIKEIIKSQLFQLPENGEIRYDFEKVPEISYVKSFLTSIINNLLTNAIKYQNPDRNLRITISGKREGDYILISVSDNGIGIDLEEHGKRIFGAFEQLDNHAEGSGIGLYIVKSLVEGSGGHVEINSQPGKGTSFNCYLKEYNSESVG